MTHKPLGGGFNQKSLLVYVTRTAVLFCFFRASTNVEKEVGVFTEEGNQVCLTPITDVLSSLGQNSQS